MIEKSWMKRWGSHDKLVREDWDKLTFWRSPTQWETNHNTGKRLGVRKQQIYTRIGKEGWTDGSAIKGSQPRQEKEQRNKSKGREQHLCKMRNDTYEARRSLSAVVKLGLIQSTNYSHWKVFYFHFQLFWFSGTETYIAQAGLEWSVHLKMSLNIWFSNLWLPSTEITGLCHCPWPFLFVFLCFEMGSCHVPLADLVISVF